MKILLMGDASNYHRSLADGLVAQGHEVTVASNGSRWMRTGRDIDVSRRPGKLGGALLWARLRTVLAGRLRGYDVVQVHNPVFLDLRPGRVREVFDRLRRDNGGVFLTALGTDTPFVELCLDPNGPLRYNEWAVDGEPTAYAQSPRSTVDAWRAPLLADHCRYIYDNIDGAVSALYEYHLAIQRWLPVDKVAYGGIPVATKGTTTEDLENFREFSKTLENFRRPVADEATTKTPVPFVVTGADEATTKIPVPFVVTGADEATTKTPVPFVVNIMLACHRGREAEKGADRMLPVLQALRDDLPGRVRLDFVQDAPFDEFSRILDRAHIVVDQLYSYTPATTALMAMARGKVTVSGAEPEYYDFIGERELRPVINADPTDLDALYRRLRHVVEHPGELARLSAEGPRFVARHNSTEVVARRFVDFWERRLR